MSNFFIAGLPRSRTTWLAAFFNSERSVCVKEVFSLPRDGSESFWDIEGYEYTGSVDTCPSLATPYLNDTEAPFVIIKRDFLEVFTRLSEIPHTDKDKLKFWLSAQATALEKAEQFADLVVPFEDIDERLEEIAYICTPNIPFSSDKHEIFKGFDIQTPNLDGNLFNKRASKWQLYGQ